MTNPSECYDHNAERFYQETHLMAPGKSMPREMGYITYEERDEAWEKWKSNYKCICDYQHS